MWKYVFWKLIDCPLETALLSSGIHQTAASITISTIFTKNIPVCKEFIQHLWHNWYGWIQILHCQRIRHNVCFQNFNSQEMVGIIDFVRTTKITMSPSSLLRLKIKNESNRPANCLYCLKGEKPRSSLYASQFSSFFLSFSLSNWSLENMLLSFSTFAVSGISCFVDDFTQPIEWFHVGPIKSSCFFTWSSLLEPLSPELWRTLCGMTHDTLPRKRTDRNHWFASTFSSPPFLTVIFTPPSRLKTRTH